MAVIDTNKRYTVTTKILTKHEILKKKLQCFDFKSQIFDHCKFTIKWLGLSNTEIQSFLISFQHFNFILLSNNVQQINHSISLTDWTRRALRVRPYGSPSVTITVSLLLLASMNGRLWALLFSWRNYSFLFQLMLMI